MLLAGIDLFLIHPLAPVSLPDWVPGSRGSREPGSGITIITIYQLLSVCRADNRESIVLIFV
jgi:hypothetical protein